MGGSAFGFGWPITYPTSPTFAAGLSPYGGQGLSSNPFASQQPYGQQPYGQQPYGQFPTNISASANPFSSQPLQQILQLLQSVPQQLQQLQQLEYQQQQQLQQVHQLLQVIPAQLVQLQHLIQFVPQQIQQMQQPTQLQQPFGQGPGLGGFAPTSPWGITAQAFGTQPGHVM